MEEIILKKKNKKNNLLKKEIMIMAIIGVFLLGISYAFFEFSKASEQDLLVIAGNIYMEMTNEELVNNDKLMYPMESSEGMEEGIKYTFTINGYNNDTLPIHYGIYINRGEDIENKVRLKDSDIMMVLYETIDGEKRKVFGPGSLQTFNNSLIYSSIVPAGMGTAEMISYQYELITWVSERVMISDTIQKEGKTVYSQADYPNTYSNLKIMVEGDFEEKNTTNGEVTLEAYTKSDNIPYITNLSYEETPLVGDDVIVNFNITKEPNKLIIINNTKDTQQTIYPEEDNGSWVYQLEVSEFAKYSYYVEYADGTNSDTYKFNVKINKSETMFHLEFGKRIKADGYNKSVIITNQITDISPLIKTLKYALIKKGDVVDNYKIINNHNYPYEIEETVTSGIYELHVLAIDDQGNEYTDYVTYEVSYDLPIKNFDTDSATTIEVIIGESVNYIESLPYKSGKYSTDKNGSNIITNETVVGNNFDVIYVFTTLYDYVELSLANYLLEDDGDARIISGGGGYNDGNTIHDANFKNYVWYSGKLWRIVALNNDGTIKLVTQHNITEIQWGATSTFYSKSGDSETKSWMYEWLNEDFLDTLYDPNNEIIVRNAKWDVTETTATTKPTSPTTIEAPVGLLTVYEYTQSYSKTGSFSTGYLNNGYTWWLLTPYYSSYVRSVDNRGHLDDASPSSNSDGARPSINLSSNIKASGGDGSLENPYTIEGDISAPTNNVTKLSERISGEYVNFNGETYRIVSIENDITKITKADYLKSGTTNVTKYLSTSTRYGGGTSSDYWDYYLNNDWYNSISTTPINYKGMIVLGDWYLGMYSNNTSYKATICTTATINQPIKNCTKLTGTDSYGALVYNGYVGLGRVGEMFTSMIGKGYNDTETYLWTITPYNSSYVLSVASSGSLSRYSPGSRRHGARPSINLSSNIVITDGDGTINRPFGINFG